MCKCPCVSDMCHDNDYDEKMILKMPFSFILEKNIIDKKKLC